jgi:outer membrane protein assembly factor BamA
MRRRFLRKRLRAAFDLHKSDLLNLTEFGAGLEHLRTLYGTAGYAQMSAVPLRIKDDSRRVIDFNIDISEGRTYNFGRLILDGPEPHAGAGYALLDSWNALEGKQYNPLVLHEWLEANRANWQNGSNVADPTFSYPNGESRLVFVKLSFPDDP